MSLQIASGLLRRLQDTIYASAPRDVREVQFATHGPVDDPTAMAGTEPDAGSADSALVLADPTSSTQEVTSQDIPAPTSPTFDNFATRSVHDTSARRRQASIPMLVTPDTNAQTELRKRILEIQTLALPEREKSRRIQEVMTEAYVEAQRRRRGSHSEPIQLGELSERDKSKTYHDEAHGILGCQHYRRGAKLQCSTCNQWATCRYCHDEHEDHKLIRKDTRNMICMHCSTAQNAAQYCQNCHIRLARYYCDKCHLWDDSPTKSIYHCSDCGICRVGEGLGKDFFHCKTCNVCMSMSLQGSHRCIERNTECDCPICGDYLFTSPETVVFMPCGHSIHQRCYNQHIKSSYRCPTCSRALINMDHYFRLLDVEVRRQPMPAPYDTWQTVILCNDCSAKSRVSFHFVGHKCNLCSSYNTVMCDILKPPEQGAAVPVQSMTPELVSAGADATASVAAILETHPYADAPAALVTADVPDQSS